MAEENKPENRNEKKGGGDFRPRTLLIWVAIIAAISGLMMFQHRSEKKPTELSYLELSQKIKENAIVPGSGQIAYNPQSALQKISGKFYATNSVGKTNEIDFRTEARLTDSM